MPSMSMVSESKLTSGTQAGNDGCSESKVHGCIPRVKARQECCQQQGVAGRVFLVLFWGLSNELNFLPLFSEVKAAYGQRRIGKGNEACFDSATGQLVREYTLE